MKIRSDDDADYYPQQFPTGSLHDLNSHVPPFAKKRRKIGFAIPKANPRGVKR